MPELSTMGFQAMRKNQGASAVFPWRILIITLVIFGLTILIYAGINFGYKPYLQSELKKIDAEVLELNKSIDETQKKEIIDFYSQLYNINALGSAHLYPARFFEFLEKTTYPLTKITSLSLNANGLEARIDGITSDFDILTEQITSYEKDPGVLSVTMDSARKRDAKDGSGVLFSAKILFKKEMVSNVISNKAK